MARILSIDPQNPEFPALEEISRVLSEGGVLAYPTETLYGLGVDAFRDDALEKLFVLKGRPGGIPVSVLVRDPEMMLEVVLEVPAPARALVNAFFPGPLTLVLPARPGLPERVTAGFGKVGVRISPHPVAALLFQAFPKPITSTSANPSGLPAARTAAEVAAYFPSGLDGILDGGPAPAGVGSTVVEFQGQELRILREGAISKEEIARVVSSWKEKQPVLLPLDRKGPFG